MIRVKICGITRQIDATRACDLGADAIGLNFWPKSKRCVTVSGARKIVRAASPLVWVVGLFVNASRDEINETISRVGLNAIQLHGDESVRDTTGYPVPVFKAVHVKDKVPTIRFKTPLVLDAQQPGFGGGGVAFDWSLARQIAREHEVLLAGGLTSDNVASAINAVRPLGVDVASGVESSPGIKDLKLMRRFIEAARSTT